MSASTRPAEVSLNKSGAQSRYLADSDLWPPSSRENDEKGIFMSVLSNLACPRCTLSCQQQYSTDKAAATGHKQWMWPPVQPALLTNLYIFQRETDTKNILSTVVTFNIFPLSLVYSQWCRKNCHLSSNQQGQTHSSVVTELSQRESSIILSAVSVSANAARHRFVTLADILNLDTVTTQTKSSEVTKIRNKRLLYAIHTMYHLYNS